MIASIIHRLSYQAYRDPELSQRARSYAVELKRYIARLRAILPRGAGNTAEDRPLETTLKSAIDSLHSDDAKLILIRICPSPRRSHERDFAIGPALSPRRGRSICCKGGSSESGIKIAAWINEREAGLHESASRRKRSGSEFDWRASELRAAHAAGWSFRSPGSVRR